MYRRIIIFINVISFSYRNISLLLCKRLPYTFRRFVTFQNMNFQDVNLRYIKLFKIFYQIVQRYSSELNLHIWNANWPMKSKAKMAAHGGQFWTSVSVSYAGLYVRFSLPHNIFHFLTRFLWKYTQNMSLKYRNKFKNFKYISTKSNRVAGYIFSQK